MHRDRLRFLDNEARRKGATLAAAVEVMAGLNSIVEQLDAAKRFIDEQTDENAAMLRAALSQ